MARLSFLEQRRLEDLFEMSAGYVLDFSNPTFKEFVESSVGVNIYDERYDYGSGSKANRLRGFWKAEPDRIVGILISDLIDYAESIRRELDQDLVAACRVIVDRLTATTTSDTADGVLPGTPPTPSLVTLVKPVSTFVSYSWDSAEHKDWVRAFADRLVSNGIDVTLDQYDLRPGDDRFQFMENSVRDADVVLCICTPEYVSKANNRASGVGVETSLITPQFYERMASKKEFIPIIREADDVSSPTPDYLSALLFVDFRRDEEFGAQMEELVRHLHKQPKYKKPPRGTKPEFD